MSPLNRGPLLGPRMPPVGMRPPPPRFGRPPMSGMPPRMPPPPHPMGAMFGPMRPRMPPPRPGGMMRPAGPPPLFGPRSRGPPPLMLGPMMGPRGMGPRGPLMRPGPRGILPPQGLPHMRPRFPPGNGIIRAKVMSNAKKALKLEELELKKPWMTDEIRSEIQKKNKLYAKAKKNKDAKEWEEFKDLRNKVTRMIREAKTEYLAKNPEQADLYQDEQDYNDERDESYESTEEEEISYYCEVCDREFDSEKLLTDHKQSHKVCGIDGCTFSAPPKLVEKHVNMQHRSGLFQKLKNLSTPEDIEKWRAERLRKYPTKSNIDLKKTQGLEKQQRGEIIKQNKVNAVSQQPKKTTLAKKRKSRKSRQCLAKKLDESNVDMYRGICPFQGTKNLPEDKCIKEFLTPGLLNEEASIDIDKISDEEEEQLPTTSPNTPFKLGGSLVADYCSDSDNEEPDETPIKRIKIDEESDKSPIKTISANFTKAISEPTEEKPVVIKKDDSKSESSKRPFERSNVIHKRSLKPQKRHMLLQRLLTRSIVHERNFICQCIKYIIDNNFFE